MRLQHTASQVHGHRVGHRIGAFVAVLVLILGLSVIGAGSASAQTAPTKQDGVQVNGCTLVPEAPSGVSFTSACNNHDVCYATHSLSRSACDAVFYKEMVGLCKDHRDTNYYGCLSWAGLYYAGVRIFGKSFYDAPSPITRIQTPMAA